MTSIILNSVGRSYGAVTAVDDIDLEVKQGEFVTLLGASGCGKTTTLRMVAGLEQNDRGTIRIGDRVVSDAASKTFVQPDRRRLGMVFQSYAIWPHLTVFSNVAYPLAVRRAPAAEIRSKVMAALQLVEMAEFAERPAPALSGGQQQRVAIARALVAEPDVLLLDEPLSNLDAKLRVQMGDEFRLLQQRLGITCLYVTHDQAEALALSDRIVVMKAGRILQVGPPEAVYFRPSNVSVAAFFGTPNLLPARVVARAGEANGYPRYKVSGDGWRGTCLSDRIWQGGQSIVAMVRPESIDIVKPGEVIKDDVTVWRGDVTRTVFRGSQRNLLVDIGNEALGVEIAATVNPAIGDQIVLKAEPESLWGLDPEPDGKLLPGEEGSIEETAPARLTA